MWRARRPWEMSLVDGLACFLEENVTLEELDALLQSNAWCVSPDGVEEQTHEAGAAFRSYEELVGTALADFMEQSRRDFHLVGLHSRPTVEDIVDALRSEGAMSRPDAPGQRLRELLTVTEFDDFVAEAQRRQRVSVPPSVEALAEAAGRAEAVPRFDPPDRR